MERLEADYFFWGDLIGEISGVWVSLILASIALTFLSPIVAMRFSEELLGARIWLPNIEGFFFSFGQATVKYRRAKEPCVL